MIAFLLAAATPSIPTAREMYVGCYLLVQGKDVPEARGPAPDPYSAADCLIVMSIGAQHETAKSESEREFCLPSLIAANPYRDMALAYLDFYEATGGKYADQNALPIVQASLIAKWPCHH